MEEREREWEEGRRERESHSYFLIPSLSLSFSFALSLSLSLTHSLISSLPQPPFSNLLLPPPPNQISKNDKCIALLSSRGWISMSPHDLSDQFTLFDASLYRNLDPVELIWWCKGEKSKAPTVRCVGVCVCVCVCSFYHN